MTKESNYNLGGNYRVFQDEYFNANYFLINQFGKRPIEFKVRDYYEENRLVNLSEFLKIIEENGYKDVTIYKRTTWYNKKEKKYYIDWYLFLKNETMIINVENSNVTDLTQVNFHLGAISAVEGTEPEEMMQIFDWATACLSDAELEKRYISIIGKSHFGELVLKQRELKTPNIPNLDLYYGNGFGEKHSSLVKLMNEKNRSGLFIFHGLTGSGKTNYIRYLIGKSDPEISFIFYPVSSLRDITAPDLITFLIDHKDSVLIIEESEESVESREKSHGDKTLIANLLNVSDGLLSDALNLKIICTFNTDIRNLDKALLREGRLLGIHHFNKISAEQANKIAEANNLERRFTEAMTLAQIFNNPLNSDLSDFVGEKPKIGFSK